MAVPILCYKSNSAKQIKALSINNTSSFVSNNILIEIKKMVKETVSQKKMQTL
jgi:hypothetical protein